MKPIGYQFLIERYNLTVPILYKKSYVSSASRWSREVFTDGVEEYFPESFAKVGPSWREQLLFALKNEGVTLSVMNALFRVIPEGEVTEFVREESTEKYRRLIWFFYEFLTGRELPIPPIRKGRYLHALNPEAYFTAIPSPNRPEIRIRKMRVINNLIGNRRFCPVIRRTEKIKEFQKTDLQSKIHDIQTSYPAEMIYSATRYLCVKETKSSFAIERLTPDQKRMSRFVDVLHHPTGRVLTKETLIQLQNDIVDKEFADHDYRKTQVYVGQSLSLMEERVHYIAPKPEDLDELMEAYLEMANDLVRTLSDPVLIAAVISFAFVFIHPFDDGNGRLHRYLLHKVLTRLCFMPEGMVFPFSVQFFKRPAEYDRMLESFSFRIMPKIDYDLDSRTGVMVVKNETADFYRFMNMTELAELFYPMVMRAIEDDFESELKYLCDLGEAYQEMKEVAPIPEEKLRLFVTFVRQNNGTLPKGRRKFFPDLSEEEIALLSDIVKNHLCDDAAGADPD